MNIEQINKEAAKDSQKQFELQRLYVKEQHSKIIRSPQIFKDEWKPEISMEMQINNSVVDKELYEVNLQINVAVKNNQITSFTAEVQQAGIFLAKGFSEKELKRLFATYAPNMLYPYARKVITSLSTEATIPPIMLVPVNFDVLYKQQQDQAKQASTEESKKATVLN